MFEMSDTTAFILVVLCITVYAIEMFPKSKDERLLAATMKGDSDTVKKLLAKGANPNCTNKGVAYPNAKILTNQKPCNWPVLVYAARNGDLESVRLLVEAGADVRGNEHYKLGPLDMALFKGNFIIAYYLLNFLDISEVEKLVFTALHNKVQSDVSNFILQLLERGMSVHITDHFNDNLLHHAVCYHLYDLIEPLIKLGVPLAVTDSFGYTPLDLAANENRAVFSCMVVFAEKYEKIDASTKQLIQRIESELNNEPIIQTLMT